MNGPLRKVSIFVALMMAALLANLTYISVVASEDLQAHPRNRRVRDAEFAQNRGAILVGNQPIAVTTRSDSTAFPWARTYPEGPLWSAITGWYSYDYGRSNLEQQYNEEMSGTGSVQAVGRVLDVLAGRMPQGANISTTLNARAQGAAVGALGDQQGAAVAINYETGEILALASTPTYDPNLLSTLDLTAERDAWDELLNASSEPLKNRAVREVYPPGSTFKLVTAAAALEAGLTKDTVLDAPRSLPLPNSNSTMGNSTNCGGTEVTLEQAMKTSCNTAFGTLGMQVGGEALQDMAQAFGFNTDLGLDLPSAQSRFPDELDEAQTALSSIGQFDVAASPLQMLMVAAAIANDGVLMQPHIVKEVTSRDLRVLESQGPTELARPISAESARQLQEMMVATVADGTGRPAQVSGLTIGGKTGTAESDPSRPNYAWFVGYAEDPKVAIVAFVQSTDVEPDDISGGRVAAPIFTAIMEALR
ncbi:penicillin-binding protein 2 [Tessaracoccus sp. OS52]|uniref:peptidoglycan D,D-transpeptidase FtsI family protein n=1 Tax=Tessaracoccus sp. OS52 TaxID=2886691 RepID=UPI001D12B8DD|nr:penicillin-binding protein 2 [Tessaracoccus sp. OS52]MCC2594588.1 penicillin-binding protein 2 [Tessaracoccus sp. OS52]